MPSPTFPSGTARHGAVVYVRVSTDEQAQHGYSLDAQEDACRKLALDRGLAVLGVYRDEGESATTAARPRFREMLDRCAEDSAVGFVVVLHTDRFARNVLDHLTLKAHLRRYGVSLLSVQQPLLDESPEGALMDVVLASMNEFYSRDIGRKIARGLAQKVKEGGWPRRAPLGYRTVRDERSGEAWIEPDPVATPIVREAFSSFASGKLTSDELAEHLFAKGIRSRTGTRPSRKFVISMLRNPAYVGTIPWKGALVRGSHEPLTDAETFAACQRVLAEHNRGLDRARKHLFLLSSVARCASCGGVLTPELHRKRSGRVFAYYRCLGRRRASDCRKRYVRAEVLEEQVRSWVQGATVGPRFHAALRVAVEHLVRDDAKSRSARRKALENRRDGIEQKLRRAEDLLLEGVIDPERGKVRAVELAAELAKTKRAVAETKSPGTLVAREDVEALVRFVRNLGQLFVGRAVAEERRLLRQLVAGVRVREGRVVSADLTPAFGAVVSCDMVRIRVQWWRWRELNPRVRW